MTIAKNSQTGSQTNTSRNEMSLSKLEIGATLPAKDINRAKKFYAEKLGLIPEMEDPEGLMYRCKNSTFMVFPSTGVSHGDFTQAGFQTDHLDEDVAALRARGVIFEEYDMPNFKTVNSIATMGPSRGAWFKDSEGNLLAISEMGKM